MSSTASQATAAVHETASSGFTKEGAALYEAGRPGWQDNHVESILRLCGVPGMCPSADGLLFPELPVLELGAGTGKFTAPLVRALVRLAPAGARINLIVSEPLEFGNRLEQLAAEHEFRLLKAAASQLDALHDGSVCAVIAAQAFHWFCDAASCTSICRVLAPGGKFAACWNVRAVPSRAAESPRSSPRVPRPFSWATAYEDVIDSAYEPSVPRATSRRWESFARSYAGFAQPPALMTWPRDGGGHVASADEMVAAALSISVIARRPEAERARYVASLREVVGAAPRLETRRAGDGAELILMPMHVEVCVMTPVAPAAAGAANGAP